MHPISVHLIYELDVNCIFLGVWLFDGRPWSGSQQFHSSLAARRGHLPPRHATAVVVTGSRLELLSGEVAS